MEVLAVGAMAVGPAASAFALDKGARKHFAEGAEAGESAANQWTGANGAYRLKESLQLALGAPYLHSRTISEYVELPPAARARMMATT
jgi:hypothetical protein